MYNLRRDIFGKHIVVDLRTGESRPRTKDHYFFLRTRYILQSNCCLSSIW